MKCPSSVIHNISSLLRTANHTRGPEWTCITCYKSSWCSMHQGRLSRVQQWKQGMTASFCVNTEWSLTLQSLSLCFSSFTISLQREQRIKTTEAVWQTEFGVTTMKERNKIRHVVLAVYMKSSETFENQKWKLSSLLLCEEQKSLMG